MNPKYPIYIISKGRWETRHTSKALERMKVPYKIVIEPQEYCEYAKVIDPAKILVLPFRNLGKGSIPARNWVWKHSIAMGAERHWLMDDNIAAFSRLNQNLQVNVTSGTIIKCAEDFVDRYTNVALAGLQYDFFIKAKTVVPPYRLNTRIYSCTLIKNDIDFEWRGKYNEDTDLSLRVLKAGYPTMLFYAFTQEKATTMTVKGGNTDNVYTDEDDRLKFAQSLVDQHPDVAKVVKKFNRWHHSVDYSSFADNKLIKKDGLNIPDVVNNYGMKLVQKSEIK
jgi:hypothetical protein